MQPVHLNTKLPFKIKLQQMLYSVLGWRMSSLVARYIYHIYHLLLPIYNICTNGVCFLSNTQHIHMCTHIISLSYAIYLGGQSLPRTYTLWRIFSEAPVLYMPGPLNAQHSWGQIFLVLFYLQVKHLGGFLWQSFTLQYPHIWHLSC